jgi:hypothetical protein
MKITQNNEEKYLFKTSNLLIFPGILGLYRGNYNTSCLNMIACLISGSFWYKPHEGLLRNIDLIFQPIFGTYMYFLGNINSNNKLYIFIGNSLCFNGLYLYYKSCSEYKKLNRLWYVYHGLFHITMASACIIVHMGI